MEWNPNNFILQRSNNTYLENTVLVCTSLYQKQNSSELVQEV